MDRLIGIAAAALARQKAGMTLSQIAEDIGRTESTVRNHLQGKSKAGQLVLETYRKFLREGVKLEILAGEEVEEFKKKLKEKEKEVEELKEKLRRIVELAKVG